MIESKLFFTLGVIKHFINNSLYLSYDKKTITGYELLNPLLEASSHNTYIETLSNKADTLYARVKETSQSIMASAYLNFISRVAKKINLQDKEVILAFDYTEEDFYGDVQSFDIHGAPASEKPTGYFKFITCSIISDEIPEKIPLISLPIRIGHYKSSVITDCLSRIKNIVGDIKLILFDRGFYDKDLMHELTIREYPYLIFVPKQKDKREILYPMEAGEEIAIYNEFKINKNFSQYEQENILVFLKEIYHNKSGKKYDWVFATNVEWVLLEKIVSLYKKRWRIETGFRVQDEARIKCKSKEMNIRYFIFLFEQLLQTSWICFYKDEFCFKEYLIKLADLSNDWTKNQRSR